MSNSSICVTPSLFYSLKDEGAALTGELEVLQSQLDECKELVLMEKQVNDVDMLIS